MKIKERILEEYLKGDLKLELYEKLIVAENQSEIDKIVEDVFKVDSDINKTAVLNSHSGIQFRLGNYQIWFLLDIHSEIPIPGKYIVLDNSRGETSRFDFSVVPALNIISKLFATNDWDKLNDLIKSEKYVSVEQYSKMLIHYQNHLMKDYIESIFKIPQNQADCYLKDKLLVPVVDYQKAMERLENVRDNIIAISVAYVKTFSNEELDLKENDVTKLKLGLGNVRSFINMIELMTSNYHKLSPHPGITISYMESMFINAIIDFITTYKTIPQFMYEDYFKKFAN